MIKLKYFIDHRQLINLLILVCVFEAYKIFDISGFPVTPIIFNMILFIYLFIIIPKKTILLNNTGISTFLFIIYTVSNFIMNPQSDIKTMLLVVFYFGFLLISYREIQEDIFNNYINMYIYITTIISTYSIYQFTARIYKLPLGDMSIPGHMVQGFNWTNIIRLTQGLSVWRSNGIYREPSFLSQMTALTLIFLILIIINNHKSYISRKKALVFLIINFVAFILSFSGTGILILIIWSLIYFIKDKNKVRNLIFSVVVLIFASSILNYFVNISIFIEYFSKRFIEITTGQLSGGMRFIGSFELLKEALYQRPLLGYGLGTRESVEYMLGSAINVTKNIDSTIPRIGIEMGIIGILLWILFLLSIVRRSNINNVYYYSIIIFLFVQVFNGDNFLASTFWPFIYFVNCKIISENKTTEMEGI